MNHKIFGKYIRSYREDKYIPRRAKIVALTMLWVAILFSVFFIVNGKWWLQLILIVVAAGVTFHISTFNSRKSGN